MTYPAPIEVTSPSLSRERNIFAKYRFELRTGLEGKVEGRPRHARMFGTTDIDAPHGRD